MSRRRRLALAGVVAAAAGAYAGEKLLARRLRAGSDPDDLDELFNEPPGTEHRTIATFDGGHTHLAECGDGRPIVLLHGLTMTTASWNYQLHDLSDRFRVVALDHRGHGKSKAGDDGYGLELLARDLAAVLDALDLEGAVLVGHSMGGMAVMRFCIDFPDVVEQRVAGVVLVSTSAGQLVAPFGLPLVARLTMPVARGSVRMSTRAPWGLMPDTDLSFVLSRIGFGRTPAPAHVELTRSLVAATPPEAMARSVVSILDLDIGEALEAVDVPALVVVGSHDVLTPPRMAREIVAHMPHADLAVLDGSGHMPMLERRQELSTLVADFAEKLP